MPNERAPFIVDYLLEKFQLTGKTGDEMWEPEEFAKFAASFMDENRPSTMQNVEGNYIIRLINGDEVSVAPLFQQGGMQQNGRAVPVTGMETVREIRKAGGPLGREQ